MKGVSVVLKSLNFTYTKWEATIKFLAKQNQDQACLLGRCSWQQWQMDGERGKEEKEFIKKALRKNSTRDLGT